MISENGGHLILEAAL